MNIERFRRNYPALSAALGSEFADSPAQDDSQAARDFARDFPPAKRAVYLKTLLSEVERLIPAIGEYWEEIARQSNRQLESEESVRNWMSQIVDAWRDELGACE